MTLVNVTELLASNTQMISTLSARIAVFRRFLDAVLENVGGGERDAIRSALQHAVEDTMALLDDLAMNDDLIATPDYHRALLTQTNEILKLLG